jgi:hypothetical protein
MELTWLGIFLLLILGCAVGVFSGMVGLGGGILVIPLLMFFYGFPQAKASGTSLAMLLLPIGALAVVTYHRAGNISWPHALTLAVGFTVGAYVGAVVVNHGYFSSGWLRVIFAVFLMYVAGVLLARSPRVINAVWSAVLPVLGLVLGVTLQRRLIRRRQAQGEPSRPEPKVIPFDYQI